MPATYRIQVAVWNDSIAPKDAICINPVFHITGTGDGDPQQLCADIVPAVQAKIPTPGQTRARAYKLPYVVGAGHVGEFTAAAGTAPASGAVRELAMCLSYYAGTNVKRRRGRLYIPMVWVAGNTFPTRPTSSTMNAILAWRTVFEGLGGVNVDWSVWSDVDQAHYPITDVWVDDEWDVIRSRGLKSSTRVMATTSEDSVPNFVQLA